MFNSMSGENFKGYFQISEFILNEFNFLRKRNLNDCYSDSISIIFQCLCFILLPSTCAPYMEDQPERVNYLSTHPISRIQVIFSQLILMT